MVKQMQKGIRGKSKNLHGKFLKNSRSNASTNPERGIKGNTSGTQNSLRTKQTIKRLNMYNQKHPDKEKMHERPTEAARIDPNRKWFGNVRTIDQRALEKLRIDMANRESDPTKIFVKGKKIPAGLVCEPTKMSQVRLLQVQTYAETFGPNCRRKRVKLNLNNMEELAEGVEKKTYCVEKDLQMPGPQADRLENRDKRMAAGQSKRIWDELHKVIDSSDVLVQVLDARDPMGTRSALLEEYLRKDHPHKHVVLLLNKADLIPVWVAAKWMQVLSKQYPTIAYKSSITNPFGKGSLINLFRQFDILHRDKINISIGFVGYPNVGKSSVINSLKERKVCKAAPIPGQTRVWQYVSLSKRIYLIDCPGTVHVNEGKNDVDSVLKGCVRAEKIDAPSYYVSYILEKVKKEYINKVYKVAEWTDSRDFLQQAAIKRGKLKKGAEPDVEAVAKIVLMDWQRGNLPYYCLPFGEVDKFQVKNITLDQVKEEDLFQMAGVQPIQPVEEQEEDKY